MCGWGNYKNYKSMSLRYLQGGCTQPMSSPASALYPHFTALKQTIHGYFGV